MENNNKQNDLDINELSLAIQRNTDISKEMCSLLEGIKKSILDLSEKVSEIKKDTSYVKWKL